MSTDTGIHNGALCESYSWCQSHSDIEIRVRLTEGARYEDLDVFVSSKMIRINYLKSISQQTNSATASRCIMQGDLEHSVDVDSVYWILDSEERAVVIYLDKSEPEWWKQLLVCEKVTEFGPRSFSVPLDRLDEASRMTIERLINDQRSKLIASDEMDASIQDSGRHA